MIKVRRAELKDAPFLRSLVVESLVHSIPPNRSVAVGAVRSMAQAQYADLEFTMKMKKDFVILVAEEVPDDGKPQHVGYIMLDFTAVEPTTGERQCFIHDLAVVRNKWGQGATHLLIDEAAHLTAERGFLYLVGHVSAHNTRTLNIATGALEFVVERHQIVKAARLKPGSEEVPSSPSNPLT